MSIHHYLKSSIPLGEAAAYFTGLKKFAEELPMAPLDAPPQEPMGGPPPAAEGASPLIGALTELVVNEFKTMLAYKVYAESMRGLAREGLEEEFEEHAMHELEHAEFLLRRLAVLSGPVVLPEIPPPPALTEPEEILQVMIQMEQEGIAKWQALLPMIENEPMRYEVEAFLARECHHLDELIQHQSLKPGPELPVMGAPGAAPPPPAPSVPGPGGPGGPSGASVKVDLKPGGGEKTGSVKEAFAERIRPGTEHYYSERMLSVLQGMPAKVYTPEGAFDGVKMADDVLKRPVPRKDVATDGDSNEERGEEKMAALRLKRAFDELSGNMTELPAQTGGSVGLQPKTTAYLENEQQGGMLQEQASSQYYKQRLDQTQAELQAAQASQQQLQQQAEALQQQAQLSQSAITAAQQSAQQATTMAMQQITQQGDKALQSQMEAAQMRAAFQQMRGQMMDLATQEPPPSALQQQPEAPPGATAPGQPGQETTAPGDQGPAGQAAPANGQPGQVPPTGDQKSETPQQTPEEGKEEGNSKPATSVTVKSGALNAAGLATGALLGGAAGLEAGRHADSLRGKVQELEGQQGSFAKAMELARNKGMLAISEVSEKHPVGASLVGSLMGAGLGHATQPAVESLVDSARRAVR